MKPLGLQWDLFCQVVDNHGDLGVCWRLAQRLGDLGHTVNLFVDDSSALSWMAPKGHPHVQCKAWPKNTDDLLTHPQPDVLIEAFGCEIPQVYLSQLAPALAQRANPTSWVWINLEYLSAEDYVERMHQMPSPVWSGPMKGQTKWFFYPGFTLSTGGLLRAHKPPQDLKAPNASPPYWVLFCYEPKALSDLIQQISLRKPGVTLKVTAGRAQAAVRMELENRGFEMTPDTQLVELGESQIEFLPYLSQSDFDDLLAQSELNFVRGEDSWVRAIWAQKPFVWQIYPQSDQAHESKLMAFLSRFKAPQSLVEAHLHWNDLSKATLAALSPQVLLEWRQWSESLCELLSKNPELGTALEHFVTQKRSQADT